MSSVDASRATEPFFTTKPAPDSVGLGLTIAQDIAAKYNGVLRIVSSPGKGTTVSISFPVSEA
jgi:signal transduction histidine kinase